MINNAFDCLRVYCVIERRGHMQQAFDSCSIFGGSLLSNGLIKRWSSHQIHSRKSSNIVKHEYNTQRFYCLLRKMTIISLKFEIIFNCCLVLCHNLQLRPRKKRGIFFVHSILLTFIFPIRISISPIEVSEWAWTEFSLYLSIHLLCYVSML